MLSPTGTGRVVNAARDESGFTMAIVMFVLLIATTLTVAAFAAAGGDLRVNQHSTDAKKAYAAAEAGVAFYLSKLAGDNDYWTHCDSVAPGADGTQPVNQRWNSVLPDPRRWKRIPRTASEAAEAPAEYTLELIPALDKTKTPPVRRAQCDPADQTSMIDESSGTFTVRSTGRVGPAGGQVVRSVLATFRRKSFLDYVYANQFETMDPLLVAAEPDNAGRGPGFLPWLGSPAGCASYRRDGRDTHRYGSFVCSTIMYAKSDKLNGPFHTNDGVKIEECGSTQFGRVGQADLVEFYDSRSNGGASCEGNLGSSAVLRGDQYEKFTPPQSNAELADTALPAYRFVGETSIVLDGPRQMKVTGPDGIGRLMDPPSNGVISVLDSGGPCTGYNVNNPSLPQPACGNAFVEGAYAKDLTITAAGDIIVTGDVTRSAGTDALLGLVATDFIRVQRKLTTSYATRCDQNTPDLTPKNRTIEAAVLSLNDVFTVDSYWCGDYSGVVTIKGSLAQTFRGLTATLFSNGDRTGYDKNYTYDDRLRFRSPPFFLTPVQASWNVIRTQEESAAR